MEFFVYGTGALVWVVARLVLGITGVLPPLLGLSTGTARWFTMGLRRASNEHSFRFEPRRPRSRVARGHRGDYRVEVAVRWYAGQEDEPSREDLLLSLECDRLPRQVGFAAEKGSTADILTGDARFDDEIEVGGDPAVLAALLDAPLRLGLRKLVAWQGNLQEGRLSWQAPVIFSEDQIARTLGELVEVADRLTAPRGGICERLSRNAREDPLPGVRLWNLTLLHQQFAGRPETMEASLAGLTDPSPWVGLAAARFLPAEGGATLRRLLEDRLAPDYVAAEAAALLAARLPPDEAGPLLIGTLKARSGEARRQAIQALGRLRHGASVGPLCVLLDRSDPRTAGAAAEALGAIGDPKAENSLLDVVRRDTSELLVAAARALGACGTVRIVEPLLELLSRRLDGESQEALQAAVNAIQSRLAGAEAGQLSLATTRVEAGRLSLATPRAGPGDVSLAKEPDGRPPGGC